MQQQILEIRNQSTPEKIASGQESFLNNHHHHEILDNAKDGTEKLDRYAGPGVADRTLNITSSTAKKLHQEEGFQDDEDDCAVKVDDEKQDD